MRLFAFPLVSSSGSCGTAAAGIVDVVVVLAAAALVPHAHYVPIDASTIRFLCLRGIDCSHQPGQFVHLNASFLMVSRVNLVAGVQSVQQL